MKYTSPTSGTVYEVKESTEYRADYREFMNPDTRYMREYKQYTIFRDGVMVQFCFNEADIANTVAHLENPGPDISSWCD
jgi:hypothetical protein